MPRLVTVAVSAMTTDAAILENIDETFGRVERPEHFADFTHCEECKEHDQTLRTYDRESLTIKDLGNPGWDPLCFCSANGIAYYFPTLARLALSEFDPSEGWYGAQLIFHLYHGFADNRFFQYCSVAQRQTVARFIAHTIETRASLIDLYGSADEFLRCHELWYSSQPAVTSS